MPDVVVDGLTFPEAPRWRDGKLWFSDFYTNRVLTVDAAGRLETVVEVPQRPSGLGWTSKGELLVVSMLDRRLLRFDGKRLHPFADLSAHATGPCNDMAVDGQDRAWVGNFGFDHHKGEPQRLTCLVRVDPNGTVITPDGHTLIVAETRGHRLTAFDIDGGALTNRRVFAALPDCFPDGICLDAEGAVWVSDARKPRVLRVFDGGRVERTIQTEDRNTFACMLGGADGRTLYICTNTGSGPAMAEKRDGRIESVKVDVPRAGWP